MEQLHPNKRLLPNRHQAAFALRAVAILCLAGCSNQQMSASNPFMSPDRVPPPATRTIAPGTAAPYYPGDPIPAAQNTPPAPPMFAQAQPPVPPTAIPPVVASPTQSAPQPLAFTNERTVAIPADDQNMRFALPPPPVPQTQPQTPAAPQMAAAPAPAPQVIPAAYNQPVAMQPTPAAAPMPTATADAGSGGPWRAPQIPNTTSPVMPAQYVQPQPGQPTVLAAQPLQPTPAATAMPVELRAVPSPTTTAPMTTPTTAPTIMAPTVAPVDPTLSPSPRMRFPSFTSPSTWFTPQPAPATNQQLIGYMVPGPNGTSQMVSVEQLQAMTAGAAQQPTSVANSDGFRPRGSATK